MRDFVKIEIMRDSKYLLPDNQETVKANRNPCKRGLCRSAIHVSGSECCQRSGKCRCGKYYAAGSAIGSNKGLCTKEFIQILIDEIDLPIIVDAGIGRPSQACEAMEMGAAAIMANTALATAADVPAVQQLSNLPLKPVVRHILPDRVVCWRKAQLHLLR